MRKAHFILSLRPFRALLEQRRPKSLQLKLKIFASIIVKPPWPSGKSGWNLNYFCLHGFESNSNFSKFKPFKNTFLHFFINKATQKGMKEPIK